MHRVKEFTLKDVEGAEHKYVCETHTAAEGMPIAWALVKAGAPGLISAFGSGGSTMDLGASAAAALATTDGPTLARALLVRTSRDGKRLDVTGIDDAYGGNYPELYEAVCEVVLHNRFLPSLDSFGARLPKPPSTTPTT